jgi:hypothetical protein
MANIAVGDTMAKISRKDTEIRSFEIVFIVICWTAAKNAEKALFPKAYTPSIVQSFKKVPAELGGRALG